MPKKLNDLPLDITKYAIGRYLTEEEKSKLAMVSKTTQRLFQPHRLQKMANKLLLQVMHGEQDKAEKILKSHPELLTITGTATDYSGRTFETTAFRYALWALDTRYMCNMMLDCLPNSPQGEAIKHGLLTQFNAQENDGLDYELNGATIHETHYDFSLIKTALQTYINNFDNWNATRNMVALTNQWSNVVGLAQRYVPAHVAQHYCDPKESFYPTPKFNKKTFVRSLKYYNYATHRRHMWFSDSGLGVNFAIAGGVIYANPFFRDMDACGGFDWVGLAGCWGSYWETPGLALSNLDAMTALCNVRTEDLVSLMQRLEGPIQKPEAFPCVIS